MLSKKKKIFFKSAVDNKEISLMNELCYEIANFQSKFKGNLKKTFVLKPSGSDMFGFDIVENQAFLGVPEYLWSTFIAVRWYVINYIPNNTGIFLVFDMGIEPDNAPASIRIHVRSDRISCLKGIKEVTVLKMNDKGYPAIKHPSDSFKIDLKPVSSLDWEKINPY